MTSLDDFLRRLLDDGRVVFRGRPIPSTDDQPGAIAVLRSAFHLHAMDVAGPPIPFEAAVAVAASELVRQSCWYLVNRSEPIEEMERHLTMPGPPRSASEHLSADLVLRFLPQVHRRARSVAPGDRLPGLLAEVLRSWPLSGVMSDIEEGPVDVGDLGGHPGLWMLYAERLAREEKPGWMPGGAAGEQVERVFLGLGKSRSPLLRRTSVPDEVNLG